MAVEVEIDVQVLKSEIKKTYASVSQEPEKDFIFPTGRPWAEDLGYPARGFGGFGQKRPSYGEDARGSAGRAVVLVSASTNGRGSGLVARRRWLFRSGVGWKP